MISTAVGVLISLITLHIIGLVFSTLDVTFTPIQNENEPIVEDHSLAQASYTVENSYESYSTTEKSEESTKIQWGLENDFSREDKGLQIRDESTKPNDYSLRAICNKTGQSFRLVPDTSNCTNYYELCTPQPVLTTSQIRGVVLKFKNIKSCQNEKLFDSISSQCDVAESAYCGLYECAEPKGIFADARRSNAYIQCVDDIPTRKFCNKSMIFDNATKRCVWDPDGELCFGLHIFKMVVWFVELTAEARNNSSAEGVWNSREGYIKAAIAAVAVPLAYLATVLIVYMQVNCRSDSSNRKSSYMDDFYYRYYRRPTRRSGVINLQPLSRQVSAPANFVTTTF